MSRDTSIRSSLGRVVRGPRGRQADRERPQGHSVRTLGLLNGLDLKMGLGRLDWAGVASIVLACLFLHC